MSETEQTTVQTDEQAVLATAERIANQLNEENAQLREELEQARSQERITPEEQRRRHGDELLGVLLGPNSGAATGMQPR